MNDALLTVEELAARLSPGERLLGVDLGTKTIGLATCDAGRRFATPLRTIRRKKFRDDAAELVRIVADEKVGGIVVGLPINMDGTEGPRAQSTRAFARNLLPLVDIPLAFWDERLSTIAAERVMLEADLSRRKRAARIDAAAAAVILQGALDRIARIQR